MNDDLLHRDSERAWLLQELLATPVGRRWLLKAGLGSAAAMAAASLPVRSGAAVGPAGQASGGTGAPSGVTLQFALGSAFAPAAQPQPSPSASAASGTPASTATPTAATGGAPRAQAADRPAAAGELVFAPLLAAAPTGQPSATPTATVHATPGATATPTAEAAATASPTPTGTAAAAPAGPTAGGVSNLVLVANGARLPLVPHTAASRAALRAEGGLWAAMDLEALTHYVADVPLPSDQALVVSVEGTRGTAQVLVSQLWYTPPAATLALARAAAGGGALKSMVGSERRLKALGLTADQVSSPEHVVQLDSIGDSHQTAVTLVMFHPNVATKDPPSATATKSLLGHTSEVQTLGGTIYTMQQQGLDIATHVPATDPDGSPSQIKVGDITTTFTTIRLNRDDAGFVRATKAAVASGVQGVRNTGDLGQVIDKPVDAYPKGTPFKTWVQSQGVTPQPQSYCPTCLGGGIDIKVKNGGDVFGTKTVVTGGYSGGQVPLKIYNNWVRWMWVYVQYLGKDGANLSANPNASFPDTKYCKSLAILPQVFTVLGIPLWDQNTIDVTLEFPQDAHTARLLYCGLGSDINGGGWRQYFPSDAYHDGIAPSDEVAVPGLLTGILTIALTGFALVTDLDIGLAWTAIHGDVTKSGYQLLTSAVGEVVRGTLPLTASETVSAAAAAGATTYEEIEQGGWKDNNLWNILGGLASVIPKVLFSPAASSLWAEAAADILLYESATKLLNAIPFLGEFVAIVETLGDVATLAEVLAETIVAPWVIENEVNLTYQATVTISPQYTIFPATARSWRLEALVDGATTLDPITDTINEDGRTRSDPLVLAVTAPFGGKQIQWSIVMLDEAGHQVATGVSAQYPNDDPNNPPAEVAFAITQIPATITAATVFKRADTTAYSAAAGGYTWSDQVPDTGTVTSGGIQDVLGAAVATRAAVAGLVWKQGDRYYLRGVPLAENGTTIPLEPAPKEGYARRPYLLFDAFVERTDVGNHVLLEPDDTSDAYHVRKVSLDPTTGALAWDPTVSHGVFTLPVSAAALHSSGRVVAVHTDSGRFGRLQPAATPRPPLGAYTAGPGTQIGLLQSPVAVAVTNPGTVLVLEGGAAQLAAFDLNGKPVRYFGTGPTLAYTLPLPSERHYLDLAVDGASQIYVLSYTGDGADPEDYRVDVYTQAGEPLDTNSPGVNVAHLAVDYWRSIYGANYDPLIDLGTTTPHIDPDPALRVAEPSLSRFDPT
jgi:hypothetical protein